MATIETLQILIEADRSGLESQLKRAGTTIQQFVNSMNKQEVSWTQILSKSITPALIGTIASTFAIAVSQALQFQNAMQQSSLSAADSFGTNSAKMTGSVLDTSSATGKSATDVAAALGTIQQVYKDTADAQKVLNAVTEEASIRDIDAANAASMLVPLFQQWGENANNVSKDLAVINESVKDGKINFNDLTTALTESGVSMSKVGLTIPQVAAQLALISDRSGLTSDAVLQVFSNISKAVQDPNDKLNLLMGGINKMADDLKAGGLAKAFQDIADHINSAGNNASSLYDGVVGDSKAITEFKTQGKSAFAEILPASQKLIDNTATLEQQMQDNMTVTKELGKAWTNFVNDLLAGPIPALEKALTDLLSGADTLSKLFSGSKKDQQTTGSQVTAGYAAETGTGGTLGIMEGISHDVANALTFGILDKIKQALSSGSAQGQNSYVNSTTTYNMNFPNNSAAGQSAKKTAGLAASTSELPMAQ